MRFEKSFWALSLLATLLLAGCSKPASENAGPQTDAAAPAIADAPEPSATNTANTDTNETRTAAAELATKSKPFATADPAIKESFSRAIIAYQIGDYARALSELQDLASSANLSAPQQKAIQDLLAQISKSAPELVATNATFASLIAQQQAAVEFPLVPDPYTNPSRNASDYIFSTADLSVRETFARAKAAYKIGNYPAAVSELKDLAANPQLNSQQKYEVQILLTGLPQ